MVVVASVLSCDSFRDLEEEEQCHSVIEMLEKLVDKFIDERTTLEEEMIGDF